MQQLRRLSVGEPKSRESNGGENFHERYSRPGQLEGQKREEPMAALNELEELNCEAVESADVYVPRGKCLNPDTRRDASMVKSS